MTTTTYTMDSIRDFCKARDSGKMVEIDEELFYYFLEVLPPIHMNYLATVKHDDGEPIRIPANFGFAEGYEPVTAFWKGTGPLKGKFYAQLTSEMNQS